MIQAKDTTIQPLLSGHPLRNGYWPLNGGWPFNGGNNNRQALIGTLIAGRSIEVSI